MQSNSKIMVTFSLSGIAAYMLSDILHEVIGHGGGCLIIGQQIDLISSVYFRSSPGSSITDLSGPIVNLITGLLIFILLNRSKDMNTVYRFLLIITMAFNLFWFSGTILQSSFSKTGDWTYFISQMNIKTFGKPLLIVIGLAAYCFSIMLVNKQIRQFTSKFPEFPLKRAIHYSYIAAVLAAIVAGLFFTPDRINAAKEGLLEMVGSIPILFLKIDSQQESTFFKSESNSKFNSIICILFVLFCLTLGHGIFPK